MGQALQSESIRNLSHVASERENVDQARKMLEIITIISDISDSWYTWGWEKGLDSRERIRVQTAFLPIFINYLLASLSFFSRVTSSSGAESWEIWWHFLFFNWSILKILPNWLLTRVYQIMWLLLVFSLAAQWWLDTACVVLLILIPFCYKNIHFWHHFKF